MRTLLLVILVAGIGTYLIRALSLVWGSRAQLPGWLTRWLTFVTPAVLGALLGPALFVPDGQWIAPWNNPALLAAIPTAAVAWVSRNMLLTVLAGVVCFAVMRVLVSSSSHLRLIFV